MEAAFFELCATMDCCFYLHLTKNPHNLKALPQVDFLVGRSCAQLKSMNISDFSLLFALLYTPSAVVTLKYLSRCLPAAFSDVFGIRIKRAK